MWQSWIFITNTMRSNLLFIFFSFLNAMCFNLNERQCCHSIQIEYFLSGGEMTLIFIVCESTESFPSPFLCWCLNTLMFLRTRLFCWNPFCCLINSNEFNEQCIWRHKSLISIKNELSICQCIICLKFTWIGRLLNFSFKSSER